MGVDNGYYSCSLNRYVTLFQKYQIHVAHLPKGRHVCASDAKVNLSHILMIWRRMSRFRSKIVVDLNAILNEKVQRQLNCIGFK